MLLAKRHVKWEAINLVLVNPRLGLVQALDTMAFIQLKNGSGKMFL